MNSTRLLWLAVLATVGTVLFSLVSLKARIHVEARNKATEMAVEFESVEALSAAQGLKLDEGLARLSRAGVSALVLSEQTIGELADEGKLQLKDANDAGQLSIFGDQQDIARAAKGLNIRFNLPLPESGEFPNVLIVPYSPGLLRSVSVGLDPAQVETARRHGLRIVARGDNPVGSGPETVRETIRALAASGATVFLPQGDQVLGRKDNLKTLVEALKENRMLYASPEFAKLGGDLNTVQLAPENVVRLHSAQTAELDKLSLGEGIERYVRASTERSIRMLLIRPINSSSERPFDDFSDFALKIKRRIELERGAVGPAKPFLEPEVPSWVFPAIGVFAACGGIYAASLFLASTLGLGLASLVFLALGASAALPAARPFAAQMAAMVFPLAAYGVLLGSKHRSVALHLLAMVAISLAGGLAVAGLLNNLPYFVRAEQFEGVKLAHFGPILLAGWLLARRQLSWKEGLESPITWIQAILGIVMLAGLALMFLRTGNDNPAAVSGLELKLRSLLDLILPARPRTKEFLVGYPALVVGLGLLMQVRAGRTELKGWAILALSLGAIALTSVVNTMCHLHTPLSVGFIRIAVGLALGGIIGAGAWMVLRLFLPKPRTSA